MKKDYFKDGESVVDSILSDWYTEINKIKDTELLSKFNQLEDSLHQFRDELSKRGYSLFIK